MEVRLVRREREHDQVGVEPVHHVPHVGVVPRQRALPADVTLTIRVRVRVRVRSWLGVGLGVGVGVGVGVGFGFG